MNTLRDASAMQVALHVPLNAGAVPKLDPEGHATYEPSTGALVFVADHLDPLQPQKTYQLWLLPADALDRLRFRQGCSSRMRMGMRRW